jgi:Mg-chelatase subunit ChlD
MKHRLAFVVFALWSGVALAGSGQLGDLRVEIRDPARGVVLSGGETSVEVTGGASVFGGVKHLDIFLVLDTSKSLQRTDPRDYRASGAAGLVRALPAWSDIRVGVVGFARKAKLLAPLTSDRAQVVEVLGELPRSGSTDLAAGIRAALGGFEQGARPDATRAILLFTDGKSDDDEARAAMNAARRRGVVVHALLLGSDRSGQELLAEIAGGTGGSFVRVTDPARLPQAFLNLRTTGVERVVVSVNGGDPVPTNFVGGAFSATVPLAVGENRVVATATTLDGRQREDAVTVTVREPGCAELEVAAERNGAAALSISDRAVEVVFDASGSMWGRMQERPKIEIAKQTLAEALGVLPDDLSLALRVYGHQHAREERNCEDSELMVPTGSGNHERIREAIAGFRPRGQTPLAHSLRQVAGDLRGFSGERSVVLVTDGIESCGGDPVAAARALRQNEGIAVHVIGFGIGGASDENVASLRAIADASGGRFFTAGSAQELRDALAVSVGTPFAVYRDEVPVARGALGGRERIRLPEGAYEVRLESNPPRRVPVELRSEEHLSLVITRQRDDVSARARRRETDWMACEIGSSAPLARGREQGGAPPAAPAPASEQPPAEPTPSRGAPGDPWVDESARGAGVQSPAAAAPRAAPVLDPRSREASQEAGRGAVEIWRERSAGPDERWDVVVRHPSIARGTATVWQGGDPMIAREVARGVTQALEDLASPAD